MADHTTIIESLNAVIAQLISIDDVSLRNHTKARLNSAVFALSLPAKPTRKTIAAPKPIQVTTAKTANSPAGIGGVGSEIEKLLKSLGITPDKTCSCSSTASRWDAAGVAWCESHAGDLSAYLIAQAARRGWLLGAAAAVAAPAIVQVAISNAKKQATAITLSTSTDRR